MTTIKLPELLERARESVGFSHNFATAKPNINDTEQTHILGLCRLVNDLVAAIEADRAGRGEAVAWQYRMPGVFDWADCPNKAHYESVRANTSAGWETRELFASPPSPQPAGGEWIETMQALVRHIESETCTHEETHRGGAIWEICDGCGMQWSDDRNPRTPFEWPKCVEDARAMLAASPKPQQADTDRQSGEEFAGSLAVEAYKAGQQTDTDRAKVGDGEQRESIGRRSAAVQMMVELGYVWNGEEWSETRPPVAADAQVQQAEGDGVDGWKLQIDSDPDGDSGVWAQKNGRRVWISALASRDGKGE